MWVPEGPSGSWCLLGAAAAAAAVLLLLPPGARQPGAALRLQQIDTPRPPSRYMDVVFHPRLPSEPRIFQSEAWHYSVSEQVCASRFSARLGFGSHCAGPGCLPAPAPPRLCPRPTCAPAAGVTPQTDDVALVCAALPLPLLPVPVQGNLSTSGVVLNEMRGVYSSSDNLNGIYMQQCVLCRAVVWHVVACCAAPSCTCNACFGLC